MTIDVSEGGTTPIRWAMTILIRSLGLPVSFNGASGMLAVAEGVEKDPSEASERAWKAIEERVLIANGEYASYSSRITLRPGKRVSQIGSRLGRKWKRASLGNSL